MSERLLIIGDALLDRDVEGRSERLSPDAGVPVVEESDARARPGGAGLAALLAAGSGIEVTLATALAPDPAGGELSRALMAAGVDLIDLGLRGSTPEKIRVLDRGRPLLRLDRGGGEPADGADGSIALDAAAREASGILVSDYGNGVAALPAVRATVAARGAETPLVWDPHPRGPAPIAGTDLATPNRAEATSRCGRAPESGLADGVGPAAELRSRWDVGAVAVTCGGDGVILADRSGSMVFGAEHVDGDPCGAGDRFAVEAAWVLACGGAPDIAVSIAAATATAFVAAGGAHGIDPPGPDPLRAADEQGLGAAPRSIAPALRRAEEVRRAGGTVVATGGCFDLLHAGHLQTLRAARALGDCLVVLLNGDRSVRRLKGEGRPVVGELERAELLAALDCVDEVAIFDEETPIEALSVLRPDVWVKGGDYGLGQMPESEALASWGARVALLPFLAGKSTTRMIEKVGQHG
jgi:rfaE bifunctional protein nucleotidyltransferase chain/domain